MLILIDPYDDKGAFVFRPNQPRVALTLHDELDGAPVIPGFKLKLRELFDWPEGDETNTIDS